MCFICGRQNSIGLHVDFYEDPEAEQVRAEFTVPDEYQGYPGVVHGGIVAAVLDEVAGRAVMLGGSDENLMATVRLALTGVGWVERAGAVGARVAGEIRLPDGTVTAECEAVLANMPEEFRARWEEERQFWKVYD